MHTGFTTYHFVHSTISSLLRMYRATSPVYIKRKLKWDKKFLADLYIDGELFGKDFATLNKAPIMSKDTDICDLQASCLVYVRSHASKSLCWELRIKPDVLVTCSL